MRKADFSELTARLYAVVSAPSGERDWESIRDLYHPRATLVRTGINDSGEAVARAMSFDEYIANADELLERVRFAEHEVSQQVDVVGNVARIASVYEYTFDDGAGMRSGRGINFFNLINAGDGWKIMSIVWDNERDGVTIEDRLL